MILTSILVVKVGTNTLIKKDASGGESLDVESFNRIGAQIKDLQTRGIGVVLVSSAAITAGMVHTNVTERPSKDESVFELQRLASIGWRHVLAAWGEALEGVVVGELLLTHADLDDQGERDQALQVIKSLLEHGDVPIINENDAISHDEISFGDNDQLAALIASKLAHSSMFEVDIKLMLLSDIRGVYKDRNDSSTVISTISDVEAYAHVAGDSASANATGGMKSKFAAAQIATDSGVQMWITNGRADNSIERTLQGSMGTHFTV